MYSLPSVTTAPTANLAILLKNLGIVTHKTHRVLLAGGGRVAYYLAEASQNDNISVTLIEKDLERATALAELLPTSFGPLDLKGE